MPEAIETLTSLFAPNKYRGHAVMLSSFILGIIYLILLSSGFAAAIVLIAGIITAPIGFLTGAATLYSIRKGANAELNGMRQEAAHQDIELSNLQTVEEGDLLQTSKALYLDRDSWKAALVSLAKFPIGMASFIFIVAYLLISISLTLSPLFYRSIDYQILGYVLSTPTELAGAVTAGIIVFVVGANLTEKTSKYYLKMNSMM
jgi:hypothetical protein